MSHAARKKAHSDAYSPQRSLERTKQAFQEGRCSIHPRVYDQLLALGVPLEQAGEAIAAAFEEVTSECPKIPDHQFTPPGQGFFWTSAYFGCRMYLKVRLEGRRPNCVLYSLHPPVYGDE